jgi:hypothetical protein
MAKVHQNLAWAVAYNIVAIPIAAGALLPQFDFAMTPSLSGNVYPVNTRHIGRGFFNNDTILMMCFSCRWTDGPELHLCRQQFFASAAAWIVSEDRKNKARQPEG